MHAASLPNPTKRITHLYFLCSWSLQSLLLLLRCCHAANTDSKLCCPTWHVFHESHIVILQEHRWPNQTRQRSSHVWVLPHTKSSWCHQYSNWTRSWMDKWAVIQTPTVPDRNLLVSPCFKPRKQQRITSRLNTNFSLSPSYSHSFHKSLYHKFFFFLFSNHSSISIHNFGTQNQRNNNTCFGAYLYSTSNQHGNLHRAGWPILFCGPTQEPVLDTANSGRMQERFSKKCRWTDRKGRNKQGRNPWQ